MASSNSSSGRSGGTGRLPSTRERRPALAALAVLLILGGALASAWLAVRAGHRADFAIAKQDVGQGQKITSDDLTTVELPEDFDGGVPEDQMDDLVGKYTTTPWTSGMVVSGSMVTKKSPAEEGMQVFAVPIQQAQVNELTAGTPVAVYAPGGTSKQGIAATVSEDPVTSSADSTSTESGPSVLVEVPAACGSVIFNGSQDDSITVAADYNHEASKSC